MNSFSGSSSQRNPSASSTPVSFDSYQFDFGIGSHSSSSARPLKDQKLNSNAASSNPLFSSSSRSTAPSSAASSWTTSPATKPSWTHQSASSTRSSLPNAPPSMVGDIFGRSWSSTVPAPAASSHLGIRSNNPNLFSDLVGSAIGHGRSSQNVPLKSTPPNNSFSMTGLSDSLPKTKKSTSSASNPSINATESFSSFNHSIGKTSGTASVAPMKSMGGTTLNPKSEDPFGSLMGSVSKPSSSNVSISVGKSSNISKGSGDDPFGAFQNPSSAQRPQQSSNNNEYSFGGFQSVNRNDFGIPVSSLPPQQKPTQVGVGVDPLDMLFPSSTSSTTAGTSLGDKPIPEMNDWDVGAEFGGHETGGTTTELEGLPPPPAGVTVLLAKTKGLDSYKQGQFADAIKWLSWTVMLLEKLGDDASSNEVLTCRASCYKEVGEYKKAIADCTKVLEYDSTNVSVLLQRALLYESSEKYRLGAEDLRTVLKLDPGNRLAKSTIHRLNKFAD